MPPPSSSRDALQQYDAEAMALFLRAQLIIEADPPELGADDRGARGVELLREALARQPKSAALWRYLAQAYALVPDHREAVVAALQALELSPGDPQAHWVAGDQLRLLGKAEDAEPHLVEAARRGIRGEKAYLPHYYLYLLRKEQSRTDDAAAALDAWAKAMPNDRYPHQLRARLLWDARRYDEALAAAVQTLERAPDDRETRGLVQQYHQMDPLQEIAVYERILKNDWVVPELHDAARRAYDRIGRFDLALEHLEWVIVLGSHSVVHLTKRKAWLQYRMHDYDGVHETVAGLLAAHPETASDPELHELRGAALAAAGKVDEAMAELARVTPPERATKVPTKAEERHQSTYARCAVRRIDLHLERRRADLALEAALGARQVLDPRSRSTLAPVLRAEVRARIRGRDLAGARETLDDLARTEDVVDLEVGLLLAEDRPQDAIALLDRAVRAQPDRTYLVGRLASLTHQHVGVAEALHLLDVSELRLGAELDRQRQGGTSDEVYAVDVRAPGLHGALDRHRASVHQDAGDAAAAEAAMRAALEHRPNDAWTLNDLAYMWAGWGTNLDEAEAMSRRALEQRPYNGGMQDTLGWVLFKKGDLDGALEALELANRYTPSEPENLSHLAAVYERLGKRELARAKYAEALRAIDDTSAIHRAVAADVEDALRALDAPAQAQEQESEQKRR